jgi:hypothetical protein
MPLPCSAILENSVSPSVNSSRVFKIKSPLLFCFYLSFSLNFAFSSYSKLRNFSSISFLSRKPSILICKRFGIMLFFSSSLICGGTKGCYLTTGALKSLFLFFLVKIVVTVSCLASILLMFSPTEVFLILEIRLTVSEFPSERGFGLGLTTFVGILPLLNASG